MTKGYTVFEVVNEKRREIFVSLTIAPMVEAIAALSRARPAAIKSWQLSDATTFRSIEFGLSEKDARAFIANYAKTGLPEGWRFLTEA